MFSYIYEHRGKKNGELKQWLNENGYRTIEIKEKPGKPRKELLIVNYE